LVAAAAWVEPQAPVALERTARREQPQLPLGVQAATAVSPGSQVLGGELLLAATAALPVTKLSAVPAETVAMGIQIAPE
jgi:hypothetical protein